MRRLIYPLIIFCAGTLLLSTAGPASAQQVTSEGSPAAQDDRIQPVPLRPPSHLQERSFQRLLTDMIGRSQSTNSQSVATRIARIYRLQAELVEAEAADDTTAVKVALEQAMSELQALLEHRRVIGQPRVREVYQTIVSEYESYYGSADSLRLAQGEIFATRDSLFAALDELDEPLLEDVMMPELPAMETAVPMDTNRLVRQSISYLLDSPDKHLYKWLSRAHTYFPMIEEVLEEEDAPNELKYLAMIESALNPRARSWASAVGMWQFMRGTARLYGLEVNHWVDERRSPERSTRAAARYLNNLYDMFDDWHLAIAAYNAGPGRVQRAVRLVRSRTDNDNPTFWDTWRYLPRETRNYVPMFIATALVVSNKDKFDLREVEAGPDYEYDLVPIEGMIDLKTIASLADTDVSTIRALNPEIRRAATPPSDGPYMIRIPIGRYEQFAQGYEALPDSLKRSITEYRVKRGDTLGEIASEFGVSIRELKRANGIRGHIIRVGQRLMVPVPNYSGNSEAFASAEPTRVQYAKSNIRPIRLSSSAASLTGEKEKEETPKTSESKTSSEIASSEDESSNESTSDETEIATDESTSDDSDSDENATEKVHHPVRYGDTLIEIADQYDVYVRDLRRWNNLKGNTIRPGQKLVIYTDPSAAQRANSESSQKTIYRVRPGDTLGEIAERHGVDARQLRAWNDIHGSRIYTGQRLTIYSDEAQAAQEIYRVRRGDSLYVIAQKHGVSVRQLKRWNDLSSNTIKPGQTLRVSG